jgi:ribonuclease HI
MRKAGPFSLLWKRFARPQEVAHLQTDGSFRYKDKISRTAALLKADATFKSVKTYFDHKNSYESEWCSILDGIQMTQSNDVSAITLENDNLGVINALIQKRLPRHDYAAVYYDLILKEVKHMDFVEIRWIPRRLNKADALFRI